jgi:hypothetical protein
MCLCACVPAVVYLTLRASSSPFQAPLRKENRTQSDGCYVVPEVSSELNAPTDTERPPRHWTPPQDTERSPRHWTGSQLTNGLRLRLAPRRKNCEHQGIVRSMLIGREMCVCTCTRVCVCVYVCVYYQCWQRGFFPGWGGGAWLPCWSSLASRGNENSVVILVNIGRYTHI